MSPNKIVLIPERQNPIMVDKIVYWQDPYFKELMDAQSGPLPYPDPLQAEIDTLRAEVTSIREARLVYPTTKAKSLKEKVGDQALAREVAEDEHRKAQAEEGEKGTKSAGPEVKSEADTAADDSKPAQATLARAVADEQVGDSRSDAELAGQIKPKTREKANAFSAKLNLKAKPKAA